MDNVIKTSVERREALSEQVGELISKSYFNLDIDAVLRSPDDTLLEWTEKTVQMVIDLFGRQYIEEGRKFANQVNRKRNGLMVETGDVSPTENKEVFE